jgi:hypothetical protein
MHTAFETYRVERLLGAGGSGKVYEVTGSDRERFAVKVLDPAKARGDRLRRFRNEIHFCQKDILTEYSRFWRRKGKRKDGRLRPGLILIEMFTRTNPCLLTRRRCALGVVGNS